MPRPPDVVERSEPGIRAQIAPLRIEAEIARVAERQSGVIGRAQLLGLGLSRSGIGRRVAAGRLHPLHRAVYAVGHRHVDRRGSWLAAVMACGAGAVLSHRSAAALWELSVAERATTELTTANRSGGGSPPGMLLHRVRSLPAKEITTSNGIPCTSVARTLLDLAGSARRRELERACERAETLRLFDLRAIDGVLRRSQGRRGARALRALLADWRPGTTLTRSELEERFLALIRAAGLPQPRLNVALLIDGGRRHVEVDALWMPQRLVVELDGHEAHGTRSAFERDRERDVALLRAGYHVARFTRHRVIYQARAVAQTLADLLAAASDPGARR